MRQTAQCRILVKGFFFLPFILLNLNFKVLEAYSVSTQSHKVAAGQAAQQEIKPLPIKSGEEKQRTISAGEIQEYVIALEAGQCLRLNVNQLKADVMISVFDSDKKMLTTIDRPNGSIGRETVTVVAEKTGTHTIHIEPNPTLTTFGDYSIKVKELSAPTKEDFKRMSAEKIVSEAEKLRTSEKEKERRQSVENFLQSLSIWKELDDKYEEAVALYGLGWTYKSFNEYNHAALQFGHALKLSQDINDKYAEMLNYAGLALMELYLGELDIAEINFLQSLKLGRELDVSRTIANSLLGLGTIQYLVDEPQKALDSLAQALLIHQQMNNKRSAASAMTMIAKTHTRLGQGFQALDYLNRALNTLNPSPANKDVEADILSSTGWAYTSIGQHQQAISFFQRALKLRRDVADKTGEASTLYGLSVANAKLNNLQEAKNNIESALNILEFVREKTDSIKLRTSFGASIQAYYEHCIDVLMELHKQNPNYGYDSQAFHISERARVRGFIDLLNEVNWRRDVDVSLLDSENTVQLRINRLIDNYRQTKERETTREFALQVQDLDLQHKEIETRIKNSVRKEAERALPRILKAEEVQKRLLDKNTTLLEFALGPKKSYLWAITRDEVFTIELPERKKIESLARDVYSSLATGNHQNLNQQDGKFLGAAKSLSQMLFGKLPNRLKQKKLVIVPQGVLQYVPFGALPDTVPNREKKAFRYLLIDHVVVVLPSASALMLIRDEKSKRQIASKTIAVFADPIFSENDDRVESTKKQIKQSFAENSKTDSRDNQNSRFSFDVLLPRLMATRWEAEAIRSYVKEKDSFFALDSSASRDAALKMDLKQYQIIHFATHAFLDDKYPELSSIVLSLFDERGNPLEGILHSYQVFNLKLNAELVVLGACQTGLGKQVKGEGIIGLTQSFMYAGTSRVIVSFWAVDDVATAELMSRFYKHLFSRERKTPAEALREAQIEMLNYTRWKSPYYWAAFTIQGDWK